MRIRRKLFLFLGGLLYSFGVFTGTVAAAGSASITLESNASGLAGSQQDLRLYVTSSGAPLYTVQTTITLSNMTYVGYTPTSTFAHFNAVAAGGSVGSTQFTVGASHQGLAETPAGVKTLVGTIKVQLGGSAGTATASQSAYKADDAIDVSPMSTSASPRSMSITAAPTPTCAAGQIGTYPNCTTPSSPSTGSGGTGGGSGGQTTTVTPMTNPNPNSSAVVPTDGGTPEDPASEIVSEDELSILTSGQKTDSPAEAVATTTTTKKFPIQFVVFGALALLLVAVGAKLLLSRIISKRKLSNPVAGTTSAYTPPSNIATDTDKSNATISSGDQSDGPSGPTIIRPGQ